MAPVARNIYEHYESKLKEQKMKHDVTKMTRLHISVIPLSIGVPNFLHLILGYRPTDGDTHLLKFFSPEPSEFLRRRRDFL